MKNFEIGNYPAIVGVGSYLPPRIVSNDTLIEETGMGSSDAVIQQLTKIEQRHFCTDGELPSELGVLAVQRALESARRTPEQIGAMFVSTMTRDMPTPDVATFMYAQLGFRRDFLAIRYRGRLCRRSGFTSPCSRESKTRERTCHSGRFRQAIIYN